MRKTHCRINKKVITLSSSNDNFIIVVEDYYYMRESEQIVHEIIRTYCFCENAISVQKYQKFYIMFVDTALTTILPILFLYLNTVIVTAGTFEP